MAYNKNAKYNREIIKNEINNVIELYNDGMSMQKIGELYHVPRDYVSNLLVANNAKKPGKRIYSIDEHYFDNIDNQNKAYILGILFADGCNYLYDSKGNSHPQISISLQEEDKEILERIRLELKYEKPLYRRIINQDLYINNKFVYASSVKPQYKLEIHSMHMGKRLEELGMVPCKSLILRFPNLDENLIPHFIRGYFDGDGSIYNFIDNHSNSIRYGWKIISTKEFCESVKNIIYNQLNIYTTLCPSDTKHNDVTYTLSTLSKTNVFIIMKWLYDDADLFMKRKYDKFISMFNISNSLIA